MSHVDSSAIGGKKGRGVSHDFELNLASIIDCFVVLIAFLLISSSFLAIGMLDAGVQAGQIAPQTNTLPPPVRVTVEFADGHNIRVKLAGKVNEKREIASENGQWNLGRLEQQLTEIKRAWPGIEGVILSAGGDVEYKDVVVGMERIRKTIPNVLLGEF